MNRREGHFQGHNGIELFYQTWAPTDATASTKTLVLTHGFAEHSDSYAPAAEKLTAAGWRICAWDLRGHGRSEGKRGFVDDFRSYAFDLAQLIRYLRGQGGFLGESFALVGHSMGGLVTLRHLLNNDTSVPQPRAVDLSSPQLGIALKVPFVKDLAARVLYRTLPSVTMFNEIHYADLTRDESVLKTYAHDPLRHDKISPGVYLGMLATSAEVMAGAGRLTMPILIQAAGDERIVSLPRIREFFPKLGSTRKELIVYEGSRHEIMNDLDRDKVFYDLDTFLSRYV